MPRLLLTLLLFAGSALLNSPAWAAELHDVITVGNSFSSSSLSIAVGDSVRWTNQGAGFHNVVADDGSFRCANGCDGTGGNGNLSDAMWSFTLTFHTEAALIRYFCDAHGGPGGSGMSGTVTVVGIFGDGFESGDLGFWATP